MRKILVYLLLVSLIMSCQKEAITVEEIHIDEQLAPYLERFREEGLARGVSIDFEAANMSAYREDIAEENVSGQCISNTTEPNRLVIDTEFWVQASDLRREFVIFHELGHCILDRGHLETTRADGTCASIMHSGLSGCQNAYNSSTRSDYLDELFLP